jgi:hypothetical protein
MPPIKPRTNRLPHAQNPTQKSIAYSEFPINNLAKPIRRSKTAYVIVFSKNGNRAERRTASQRNLFYRLEKIPHLDYTFSRNVVSHHTDRETLENSTTTRRERIQGLFSVVDHMRRKQRTLSTTHRVLTGLVAFNSLPVRLSASSSFFSEYIRARIHA